MPLHRLPRQLLRPRYLPSASFRNAPIHPNLNTACVYAASLVKHWSQLHTGEELLNKPLPVLKVRGKYRLLTGFTNRRFQSRNRIIYLCVLFFIFFWFSFVFSRSGRYNRVWYPHTWKHDVAGKDDQSGRSQHQTGSSKHRSKRRSAR